MNSCANAKYAQNYSLNPIPATEYMTPSPTYNTEMLDYFALN